MIALPRRWSDVALLLCRLVLGGTFVWAGALKAMDPAAFLMDVRSFHLLGDPWAAWLAMGLPWLEILCGLAVISGVLLDGAALMLAGMLVAFLGVIGISWLRGLDISCGCFGKSEGAVSSYVELVVRDVALLAVAAVILRHRLRRRRVPAASAH